MHIEHIQQPEDITPLFLRGLGFNPIPSQPLGIPYFCTLSLSQGGNVAKTIRAEQKRI